MSVCCSLDTRFLPLISDAGASQPRRQGNEIRMWGLPGKPAWCLKISLSTAQRRRSHHQFCARTGMASPQIVIHKYFVTSVKFLILALFGRFPGAEPENGSLCWYQKGFDFPTLRVSCQRLRSIVSKSCPAMTTVSCPRSDAMNATVLFRFIIVPRCPSQSSPRV